MEEKGDRLLFRGYSKMPGIMRGLVDGLTYHVLNRGNGGQVIFHKDQDYRSFIGLMMVNDQPCPPVSTALSGQWHVWQGRFKSLIIKEDGYLLTLPRYVEGNPVRSSMVGPAKDWPWSSCRDTCSAMEKVMAAVR